MGRKPMLIRKEDEKYMYTDDIMTTPIPLKGTTDGCFNRIPYASLMAAVMCFIGVILFTIMMTWGFNATAEQTKRTLNIQDWPWLDKVQIFFIVLTVLMTLFALFFLAVGFTATGATREYMYRDVKSKCGGKFACVLAMFFTVALFICWLLIISAVSMICIAYETFYDVCDTMTTFNEADCIDFGIYEPLVHRFSRADMMICGGDAQQFCALTSTARTWYFVGWVGSAIVLLGLAMFLAIHTANYAHVSNASRRVDVVRRYVELRDLLMEPIPAPPSFPPPRLDNGYSNADVPRDRNRQPYPFDNNNYDQGFGGWERDRPPRAGSTSTRMAEAMSDSVSQYQYDRKFFNHVR